MNRAVAKECNGRRNGFGEAINCIISIRTMAGWIAILLCKTHPLMGLLVAPASISGVFSLSHMPPTDHHGTHRLRT